jgi:hypothetical protein
MRAMRQRFGFHAAPVLVRHRTPWYSRWSRRLAVMVLLAGMGWWLYELGKRTAEAELTFSQTVAIQRADTERSALATQAMNLRAQNDHLTAEVARLTNQAKLDAASLTDVSRSMTELQDQIANLKEQLALFQKIVNSRSEQGKLDVYDFVLRRDGADQYRYQAYVFQGGGREKNFRGKIELVVSLEQGGRNVIQTLRDDAATGVKLSDFSFKYYKRLEGGFKVPPGATVRALELRLFDGSGAQPKIVRTARVS